MGDHIDDMWREVVLAIPSRHMVGAMATSAFGFRRFLAEEAYLRDDTGNVVRYLEIGVRLGHSMAFVALAASEGLEKAVGIDAWIEGYGGEPNPGPDAVYEALTRLQTSVDNVALMTGSSHDLLPTLRASGERFDIALVDGDHTADGARADLETVMRMMAPEGLIVFDDASFKGDTTLLDVWREVITNHPRIAHAHEVLDDEPGWCWAMLT